VSTTKRAVVVGSGPNGLAAAITLASAGIQVVVYERASRFGGGTRSSELTIDGLIHDECSGFHPLAVATEFAQLARLEDFGLVWRWPKVQYSSPLLHGVGAAAYRTVADTAAGLGADATAWRSVFGSLEDSFADVSRDFLQPVLRVPNHPLRLAQFGLRAGLPAAMLARRFRTEEGRALFGGVAAHAIRPFSSPLSSAIGVALGTAAHSFGWPVAAGGSQAIANAMVQALLALGGRVETNRHVDSVAELGDPDIVMLDVAPQAAVALVGDALPGRVRNGLARYQHGPGAFKVDFAVEQGVPWGHAASHLAGTVHVGGTYAETAQAEVDVHKGRMPAKPFVLVGQQYLADPQRSSGDVHPVYAYAHVPADYQGDATVAIEEQIERFAPGFRERIVVRHVQSTTDLAKRNPNYVGGDIVTGANSPRQLVFRPRVTTSPYSLGVPGMYLCSAATPPGAGAHGMCGFNAARVALREHGIIG